MPDGSETEADSPSWWGCSVFASHASHASHGARARSALTDAASLFV
ncbi:hypothetical protein [Streptomyces viridochromogenes]|nr:hypothetical protein [Streptomyces viridochromogenes]